VTLITGLAAFVVTLLAAPIADWIGKAPEIGQRIKQQLYLFERPLSALQELESALMPAAPTVAVEPSKFSMVTPVLAFVTPALAQVVIFFATFIFFLAGEMQFRRHLAGVFATRDSKLRFIRIANDIEENLAAFWSWLWDRSAPSSRSPLLIVGTVVFGHVFPADDSKLPG